MLSRRMEPQLEPVSTDAARQELRGGVPAEGGRKLLGVVDGGLEASTAHYLLPLRHVLKSTRLSIQVTITDLPSMISFVCFDMYRMRSSTLRPTWIVSEGFSRKILRFLLIA